MPVLFSFRRCPYAIRARLAIRAAGVTVRLREVALASKPDALLAASPKATVPVLQWPDGAVLDQSLDIMRWALRLHDPQGWVDADEQPQVLALVELNDGAFKQALDGYKYAERHLQRPARAWRDEAAALMLAPLEQRLARHRFVLRGTPSLADMAIVPFVRQFAVTDPSWFEQAPFRHVRAWLLGITGSPLFGSVMAKLPPWQPGQAEVVF